MNDAPGTVPFQVIGVGVVLNPGGEVLIDQRLNEGLLGGLWEFPGGKQEPGEPIAETIRRELEEELAIAVEVGEELPTVLVLVGRLFRSLESDHRDVGPVGCRGQNAGLGHGGEDSFRAGVTG